MFEYLQPFELACVTNEHTGDTYINAAAQGSTEYINNHPEFWWYNDTAWSYAAANGQLECVQLFYKCGAFGIGSVLAEAAGNGHIKVIEWLVAVEHAKSKPFIQLALNSAAGGGHINIIDMLVKINPDLDFNSALIQAAFGGQQAAIHRLVKLGANNFAEARMHALINSQTVKI